MLLQISGELFSQLEFISLALADKKQTRSDPGPSDVDQEPAPFDPEPEPVPLNQNQEPAPPNPPHVREDLTRKRGEDSR